MKRAKGMKAAENLKSMTRRMTPAARGPVRPSGSDRPLNNGLSSSLAMSNPTLPLLQKKGSS